MSVLKSLLKYVGYTAFFLVALVCFIYLTLPFDQLESYLVRKASDEYNADLDIVSLSTWGLMGLEAEGVTFTPRPTPEQLAEIEAARLDLIAWEAAREAKKAAAAAAAAPKAPPLAGAGDTAKGAAKAKNGKQKQSEPVEERPKIPDPPAPILVNVLRVGISPWKPWALPDAFEGRLEAELLGGSVEADVDRGEEEVTLAARWEGLDLTRISVLRDALPLPLAGTLEGLVEVGVPVNDAGKPQLGGIEGKVELKLAAAELGPGRVPAKLGAFDFFDAPKARIGDLTGRIEFEPNKRRATLHDFQFKGADAEGQITGYIQIDNRLKRWGPRLHLRIKLDEPFVKKNSLSILTGNRKVKRGIDEDGFLGLGMSGVMSKPSFRITKRSPYVKKSRTPKATGARAKTLRERTARAKKKPLDRTPRRGKDATKAPRKPPSKPVKPSVVRRDRKKGVSTARAKLGEPTTTTGGDDGEEDDEEGEEEGDEEDADDEAEEEAREDEEERKDDQEEGEGGEGGEKKKDADEEGEESGGGDDEE